MKTAIIPGSFDPVTKGHIDLIKRACGLYDTVYVGVLHNPDKSGLFTPEERKAAQEQAAVAAAAVIRQHHVQEEETQNNLK